MTYAFSCSLAARFARLALAVLFVCAPLALLASTGQECIARSALSPRHSGLEPPGGPRILDNIPGPAPGRTPMGAMGYTDAYGNELGPQQEEPAVPRKRLRPGANSNQARKDEKAARLPSLPDTKPMWKF